MPNRREREAEPAFVDDFAGSKRAEHARARADGFRPACGPWRRPQICALLVRIRAILRARRWWYGTKIAGFFVRFAVPAAIFELFAQEFMGQCVVRFLEIRTDPQDSAVNAGLRFAVKVRPVVEPRKHEPLVDAVDRFASLLAGGVQTEVLQDHETVEGDKAPLRPPQFPAGDWTARSCAPQPSVATRDRSAAIGLAASPVRSLMTCQRMAGSESRSHLMCACRGAFSCRRMGLLSQVVCTFDTCAEATFALAFACGRKWAESLRGGWSRIPPSLLADASCLPPARV